MTGREWDRVVREVFPDRVVGSRWPGVSIVRDDGFVVGRGEIGGMYVFARCGERSERLDLSPIDYRLSVREQFFRFIAELEGQLETFWQQVNPGWPGLGPAGNSESRLPPR